MVFFQIRDNKVNFKQALALGMKTRYFSRYSVPLTGFIIDSLFCHIGRVPLVQLLKAKHQGIFVLILGKLFIDLSITDLFY